MNNSFDTIQTAIYALQSNQPETARQLLHEILIKEPDNLVALMWLCEVASTKKEKIACLEKILSINPSDSCTRSVLKELLSIDKQPLEPNVIKQEKKQTPPIGQLASAFQLLILFLASALLLFAGYSIINGILPGQQTLFSEEISISEAFDQINSDELEWRIVYENKNESTFTGKVRHTSRINIPQLSVLTHDILITSGDFADPELVNTNVTNHHFRWFANQSIKPQGTINLLHTVPSNEEILKQLESIRREDVVQVKGKEILVIKVYDIDGALKAEWRDNGCNTLLVHSVSLQK